LKLFIYDFIAVILLLYLLIKEIFIKRLLFLGDYLKI